MLKWRLLAWHRLLRGYNFACLGYLEGLNAFSRGGTFMSEPNNRVLTRRGARIVTEAEMAKIGGAFSSSVIITDVVTDFGRDFSVDHIEN
jgi:hypothetical protein